MGLSKSSFRVKVSVGSNPWAPEEPMVNLAKICERYGGGGHARVGAISFEPDQHAAAIKASREIVDELRAAVRDGPVNERLLQWRPGRHAGRRVPIGRVTNRRRLIRTERSAAVSSRQRAQQPGDSSKPAILHIGTAKRYSRISSRSPARSESALPGVR